MLITDPHKIGNKMYHFRKLLGYTQAEVAEKAGLSDRTYADIERGTVDMRLSTLLKICNVLHISPDDITTEHFHVSKENLDYLLESLNNCTPKQQETAFELLSVYFNSLK